MTASQQLPTEPYVQVSLHTALHVLESVEDLGYPGALSLRVKKYEQGRWLPVRSGIVCTIRDLSKRLTVVGTFVHFNMAVLAKWYLFSVHPLHDFGHTVRRFVLSKMSNMVYFDILRRSAGDARSVEIPSSS